MASTNWTWKCLVQAMSLFLQKSNPKRIMHLAVIRTVIGSYSFQNFTFPLLQPAVN